MVTSISAKTNDEALTNANVETDYKLAAKDANKSLISFLEKQDIVLNDNSLIYIYIRDIISVNKSPSGSAFVIMDVLPDGLVKTQTLMFINADRDPMPVSFEIGGNGNRSVWPYDDMNGLL